MQISRSFEEISCDKSCLLTIGTFDGVHRGHRYLLEQARARASEQGLGLVVVTFDPCPAVVLRPDLGRYQISSAAQKLSLLDAIGPSVVAMLDFTVEMSQLTAEAFLDALEQRLDVSELWFGEDFRFGRGRAGDLPMLVERGRASGFSLHVVSRRVEEQASISSSRVRKALRDGDVEGAVPLLGYPLSRECAAPSSDRWLDDTTDAVSYSIAPHLALPADGIYAVLSTSDERSAGTLAQVRGSDLQFPLRVRMGAGARDRSSVEFLRRMCSADDYHVDAARWDSAALEWLTQWRRPAYGAAGHH